MGRRFPPICREAAAWYGGYSSLYEGGAWMLQEKGGFRKKLACRQMNAKKGSRIENTRFGTK